MVIVTGKQECGELRWSSGCRLVLSYKHTTADGVYFNDNQLYKSIYRSNMRMSSIRQ